MSNVSLYYPPHTQRRLEELAPIFKGNKSAVFQAAIDLLHTQVTEAAKSTSPMPVTIEA